MIRRLCAAGLLACAACSGTAADWRLEAGLQAHTLEETSPSGARLVRESGVAPVLGVALHHRLAEHWALAGRLSGWHSRADYDGRTQAGQPVASRTATGALGLESRLVWQPAAWRAEAGVQWEVFDRRIQGTAGALGLDERLQQGRLDLGAGWQRGPWDGVLRLTWGDRGRLRVRFDGAAFDDAHLRSGTARGVGLELSRRLAPGWRARLSLERLDVGASQAAALARAGLPFGSVAQPTWRRERAVLTLERRFD
ncbi:hypothetical protein [Aquabacterium sp. J223]|uniref:hypothetical protein n=1 Tax=Aquabacterium sp. J223 TaxID=2898431 RepID=UPI0021AD9386|nr:hypothetical protein [Aquabacterium sp. J223]UUX96745.1 hypothetical protein LRS07_05530 [Aquabacterium sp. J223]